MKKYLRGKNRIFCYLTEYESESLTLNLPKQNHPLFSNSRRCSPRACVHPRPLSPEQLIGAGVQLCHRNTSPPPQWSRACPPPPVWLWWRGQTFPCFSLGRGALTWIILPQGKAGVGRSCCNLPWLFETIKLWGIFLLLFF